MKSNNFKKIITGITALCVMATMSMGVSAMSFPNQQLKGDLNDNNIIDTVDVLEMKKVILGITELNGRKRDIADMNNDRTIDITDLIMLKNTLLGEQNPDVTTTEPDVTTTPVDSTTTTTSTTEAPVVVQDAVKFTFSQDGVTAYDVDGNEVDSQMVNGTTVTITVPQEYTFDGSCDEGQIVVNVDKTNYVDGVVTLNLEGLTLSNSSTSPIYVESIDKECVIASKNGTTNLISDGTSSYTNADGGVGAIWGSYIRYIGAGALATGGIISLIKSLPMIVTTFRDSMKALAGGQGGSELRTDKNISMKVVVICLAVLIVLTGVLPQILVGIGGALLIAIFGFFFAAVSSRMVGIVGSSNNPVSGMAIATLLFSTIILKATGAEGAAGMKAAIAIGTVICIVAAIAGDTSQDLKTGYLVGATPIKQQYGEIIGTVVSAIAIGGVLYLLDAAWGFGSEQLGAPQATLMKMIVEGVMGGKLPWGLVIVGVVLACVVEILGIPVLPFAIGVYLPIQLSACIMIGGLVRLYFDRKKYASEQEQTRVTNRGVLYCSGMIAGEGLVGIVLAILAVIGVSDKINMAGVLNLSAGAGNIASTVVFAVMILLVFKFTLGGRKNA